MITDLNRHFTKEDRRMENTHVKRYSILFAIREKQIKTIVRNRYAIRMAKIKKC